MWRQARGRSPNLVEGQTKGTAPIIILSIFSGLAMGWEGFFWIGAIRLVYVLHFQMFVNSLLHMTPGLAEGVDRRENLFQ